jgi:hypothetical protein
LDQYPYIGGLDEMEDMVSGRHSSHDLSKMGITANTQVLGVADQGFHAPPQVVPPAFRENGILDQQLR